MKKIIQIRAHHLACIPRFYRGGYDKNFAKNMKSICATIRKNPDTKIKILVGESDDLCLECLYKDKAQCVQSKRIGSWVLTQDRKVTKYLRLRPNSVHIAKEVFNLSMDKINQKTIGSVCKGCIFLDNCTRVGINNSFRKDLNKNDPL
jgi:uncharacterized protein